MKSDKLVKITLEEDGTIEKRVERFVLAPSFSFNPVFSLLILPSQSLVGSMPTSKQATSGCATSMRQKPFSSLLVPRAQLHARTYGIDLFGIGIPFTSRN